MKTQYWQSTEMRETKTEMFANLDIEYVDWSWNPCSPAVCALAWNNQNVQQTTPV